ncbi:MAG: polysaccharide deacetylase family protein [Hyphomicrobiaceae bacterium]|nr:polysaccharide deacetylase family protein [Hyphomicrobiaceae bacterium]
MSRTNTRLLKAVLSALSVTGADRIGARWAGGIGAIFMLHHVLPETGEPPRAFAPNRPLAVTPEFLAAVVDRVQEWGYDVIALDDVPGRLAAGSDARPFCAFTFDDGYRDNREHAYPIFKARGLPFAIYVPSAYADGAGDLWWLVLEQAILRLGEVRIDLDGRELRLPARTDAEKVQAHHAVYWKLREMAEDQARAIVARLAADAGVDGSGLCRDLVMSWSEIGDLARDPLVTIGAHTVGHYALAKLTEERMRAEIEDGKARIEAELARPCRHFSYPYGSEIAAGEREFAATLEAGFATAVTTRKGLIERAHAGQPTALPRVSLNGDFQDISYVRTLLTGVPFALMRAAERSNERRLAGCLGALNVAPSYHPAVEPLTSIL